MTILGWRTCPVGADLTETKLALDTELTKDAKSTKEVVGKSARRITKGVIHVQANFNNTIVTVTEPQGTCGFKSSRKASPYAGQRIAVDAIRTVGLQ
uniref:Uncharacterized protein n=1 Tax=Setaria viridis TaxID=4556 RepID=A0A4U6V422_SETVI|nr:hypothetical protein SEVIR_4G128500v2 [Setaria viridis]